jgi:hypothetical protein
VTNNKFSPTIIEEGLGTVAIAGSIAASPVLRPWYCKWGATSSELQMPLPGDKLVPKPWLESTRAISWSWRTSGDPGFDYAIAFMSAPQVDWDQPLVPDLP